jgi:hypothetical protein
VDDENGLLRVAKVVAQPLLEHATDVLISRWRYRATTPPPRRRDLRMIAVLMLFANIFNLAMMGDYFSRLRVQYGERKVNRERESEIRQNDGCLSCCDDDLRTPRVSR